MKLVRLFVEIASCTVLIFCFAHTGNCQNADTQSITMHPGPAVPAIDVKAHDATVHLVQVLGLKEKMIEGMDADLDKGVEAMKAQVSSLSPEFTQEWRRRMKARLKPEDFVAVVVQVYERHFTTEELEELSNVAIGRKEGKAVALPQAFKEKFQKDAVEIQSEIIGGTSQIGAKLGMEIGQEIAREHPDWTSSSASQTTQPSK